MLLELIATVAFLFALFYFYMTRNFGYFAAHGVYEEPGSFPFGSETNKNILQQKVSFITATTPLYQK